MTDKTLAPAAQTAAYKDLGEFLTARVKPLVAMMGSTEAAQRLISVALKLAQGKPDLLVCDRPSFFHAVRSCAELGLEPNALGHAWFVPFNGKVQFLLGYRGMIELAYRNPRIRRLDAHAVYANDGFDYEHGLTPKLAHRPKLGDRGELVAAYALAELDGGRPVFLVLSRAELEARRARGKAGNSGPWVSDYAAMARKSAVRALFPLLPLTPAMERAQVLDETEGESAEGFEDPPEAPRSRITEALAEGKSS